MQWISIYTSPLALCADTFMFSNFVILYYDPLYIKVSGQGFGIIKIQVFWDVILCQWASNSQHFEGLQCLKNVGNYSPSDHMSQHRRLGILDNTAMITSNCTLPHHVQEIPGLYISPEISFPGCNFCGFLHPLQANVDQATTTSAFLHICHSVIVTLSVYLTVLLKALKTHLIMMYSHVILLVYEFLQLYFVIQ